MTSVRVVDEYGKGWLVDSGDLMNLPAEQVPVKPNVSSNASDTVLRTDTSSREDNSETQTQEMGSKDVSEFVRGYRILEDFNEEPSAKACEPPGSLSWWHQHTYVISGCVRRLSLVGAVVFCEWTARMIWK